MRKDDRGTIEFLDDLGHGESFARTGDAEQNLVAVATLDSLQELGDGNGLVAAGLVIAGEFEFHGHGLSAKNGVR